MAVADTREAIMGAARSMVQAEGYNALSFRDLATAVGVKSASVHYHFPTKGDLGEALARHYTEELKTFLAELSSSGDDFTTLMRRYVAVFRQPLVNENRMCLWGIMAAEHEALPQQVRAELDHFVAANVKWLAGLLASHGEGAEDRATAIFAAIEGAQLVAHGRRDVKVFDATIEAYRKMGLLP